MKSTMMILLVLAVVAVDAKCGTHNNCGSCVGAMEGFFNCRWCASSNSCHSYSIDSECSSNQQVIQSFDCPIPPRKGYEYDDNFARNKVLSLIAATYSDNPQNCLTNAFNGTLKRQLTVHCDESRKDTCSGYTALSHQDRAIVVSFRGTSGNWQLVLEGVDSVFANKIDFIGGGKVDEYFYRAFYALWNAGMRDDLSTMKHEYPSYQLWVFGHSLGGAMASLAAGVVSKTEMWKPEDIKMVTIGQPRTGDLAFAQGHEKLVYYSYRVVHAKDAVPHIPYKNYDNWFDSPYHHRYEVWYDNDMKTGQTYQVCTRGDDDTCSGQQSDTSISDHLHYFDKYVSSYGIGGCIAS